MTAARPYIPRPGERAPVAPRFKRLVTELLPRIAARNRASEV